MNRLICLACPDGFVKVSDTTPDQLQRCTVIFRTREGGMEKSKATWDCDVFNDRECKAVSDFHEWKACCWA
jgi:hypothetical protein